MTGISGVHVGETKIYSEIKRGLIIGQGNSPLGERNFFLMACNGSNSAGTVLSRQKIVALSILGGIIMALSAKFLWKLRNRP